MIGTRVAGALLATALLAGCHPTAPPVTAGPAVAPELVSVDGVTTWGRFRTLKAEHRVTVEAHTAAGETDRRTLRGLIAVERPGHFRLRALGPGGITLFDVLYVDGNAQVIESIRDPKAGTLAQLLASIAGDLALAYDLAPRPVDRTFRAEGGDVIGTEPGRTVRHREFRRVGGTTVPSRTVIENSARAYRVEIEARNTTVDEPLDPELFKR